MWNAFNVRESAFLLTKFLLITSPLYHKIVPSELVSTFIHFCLFFQIAFLIRLVQCCCC